jgi:hypothetical protein
VYAQVRL